MKTIKRIFLSVFMDIIAADIAVVLTVLFTENFKFFKDLNSLLFAFLIYPAILVVANYIFNIYKTMWIYSSYLDYLRLSVSIMAANFIFYVVKRVLQVSFAVPFTLQDIMDIFFITVALLAITRITIRMSYKKDKESPLMGNIMVIGAGDAGNMIINDINSNRKTKRSVVKCAVDDDVTKIGNYIAGVKVAGSTSDIIELAKDYDISTILFAIPTCPVNRKSAILKICQKTDCQIKTVPSLSRLVSEDKVDISSVREIEIEDLLGREPIDIKVNSVMDYVKDKVVLITGGGGSIGSELCRQIAEHNPKQLIIFDIYENTTYDIQNELLRNYPDLNLEVKIGSVRDEKRLEGIFEQFKPQIVYHAAAHKHVPLMEDSPNESVKNNVFGTLNTVKCADKFGVQKFVLISTDKAVNPTNIMGATKRICEMIVQSYNNRSATEFVAVRFGNVLGSNGSVIPLFKNQIKEGGPITVTDPNIIRYFMTIPEAVSLVLQAGASAKGGEIFVLDMGEPVKILDLAENLIKLSGFKPYIDIKIEFTGLRPGEKLYEEKLMLEEGLRKTENTLIHIGNPIDIDEENFYIILEELKAVMSDENADIRKLVKKIVPTYSYISKNSAVLA